MRQRHSFLQIRSEEAQEEAETYELKCLFLKTLYKTLKHIVVFIGFIRTIYKIIIHRIMMMQNKILFSKQAIMYLFTVPLVSLK